MAEETFNELYSRYNTDDVFNRVVIIGLLDLLNNHMSYNQIWEDNVVEKVLVPFMYDFGSSDERFAQDNYTFFGQSCFNSNMIPGKFDVLPRGVLKYTGSNIDASNITNRFIKGTFLKNENGKLTSYTAMMYSIPLTFNFECEMWIDNMVTAFKIEQALRDTFYKNKTYNVLFMGMKVGCSAGFPENTTLDKTTSYAFDSERQIKLTFSLAVETYQPSFDMTTALETDKTMEHLLYDVEVLQDTVNKKPKIELKLDKFGTECFKGSQLPIKWNYFSNLSDMCTVILSYIENGKEHTIDVVSPNSGEYIWNIPDDFTDYEDPIVIFDDYDDVEVEPKIKMIPDKRGVITASSFRILSYGKFKHDGQYTTTIEYTKDDGTIEMSSNYVFNVINGSIDLMNPVTVLDVSKELKYKKDYNFREIQVKITYSLDNNIYDKSSNLLII